MGEASGPPERLSQSIYGSAFKRALGSRTTLLTLTTREEVPLGDSGFRPESPARNYHCLYCEYCQANGYAFCRRRGGEFLSGYPFGC